MNESGAANPDRDLLSRATRSRAMWSFFAMGVLGIMFVLLATALLLSRAEYMRSEPLFLAAIYTAIGVGFLNLSASSWGSIGFTRRVVNWVKTLERRIVDLEEHVREQQPKAT